ncbi:MAG: MurR/RpiR family transcriptional regulator [Erysipelotrichaceae bacterium]|jgi:DNA-binding MurR/RpiR family transcriptional regulator|nr:MurR/RpiR family transcriptional regulator [Erysipelotrichaceae bacterium]
MIKALLKSKMSQFSKQEKNIASYLLELDVDPRILTSNALAEQLGISQSTVIRFTQKLGYESFRTFLVDLNKVYADDLRTRERDLVTSDSMKILISRYEDAIHETNVLNKPESIKQAVDLILNADRIVVYGAANSSIFAEYLNNQLNKTGLFVQFSKGIHACLVSVAQLSSKGVVVLISQSGETEDTLEAATQARSKGIPIIALTGHHKNTLHEYSDIVLYSSDYAKNLMNIRISQLFLVDILIQEITERK